MATGVGIETLHASLDAGCRHIDTAWAYYCSGGEEQTGELVREALETWKGPKDEVLVATKVGHFRNFTDGRPVGWTVARNLIRRGKESALALGVDTIDLLYFHRPDPKVPYNESVEAIKQLVDEGVAQRPVSPTPPSSKSTLRAAFWATSSWPCKTSTRRFTWGPRTRSTTAPRLAWPSCAGARSAATVTPMMRPSSTRSARSRRPTA